MSTRQAGRMLNGIDRIVVVYNQRSTRSQQAEELIRRLRKEMSGKPVGIVRLGNDGTSINRRGLMAALRHAPAGRTLIISGGGDGTAHFVAAALLHADTPEAYRTTPITPWPLGNGNDFFNSVHDAAVAADPLQALVSPAVHRIHVHPLEWRVQEGEEGESRRFSLCYGTIGATGNATAYINRPDHRAKRQATRYAFLRLFLDARQAARALWFPRHFTVRRNGRKWRATELQFNNGPIMTMRARYPIRLSERGMFVSTSRSRHPLAIIGAALRLGLGAPRGTRYTSRLTFRLSSEKPLHAQTDGEPFTLPPYVQFSIGPSTMRLTVWATKTDA